MKEVITYVANDGRAFFEKGYCKAYEQEFVNKGKSCLDVNCQNCKFCDTKNGRLCCLIPSCGWYDKEILIKKGYL